MTHKAFCVLVITITAAWFIATGVMFSIVVQWMTIDQQTVAFTTNIAIFGATALLLMPGSTALAVSGSGGDAVRPRLLIAAGLSIIAGAFHGIVPLWSWFGFGWCLVLAGVSYKKVRTAENKRAAAIHALALIPAIVLPFVAVTSWYVFDYSIPQFLRTLLETSGATYGTSPRSVLVVENKMESMMALGGPLAFAVVGLIWNAGTLVLISFHERFRGRQV